MKMAKASEADLKMAMDLSNALESVERDRCFPMALRPNDDDLARFDIDDGEHCKELVEYLLKLVGSASLMRVVWGMAVLLDPRNQIVDPNADTLERYAAVQPEAPEQNVQEESAQAAQPALSPAEQRQAFERANVRDIFGQQPTYRERELMFQAWQAALSAQPTNPEAES